MEPVAHGASIFVPGYGTWQAYRHFALIGQLLTRIGSPLKLDPSTAALGTTIWWVTWLHYSGFDDPILVLLNVIELVAGTAVVVFGQRALNAYWALRSGPPADERLLPADWFALGVAAAYFVLVSVTSATTPTN